MEDLETMMVGDVPCVLYEALVMTMNPSTCDSSQPESEDERCCILCGTGPFSDAGLAEHFTECFDEHCPISMDKYCTLCGKGPFQPYPLKEHFEKCFEENCPLKYRKVEVTKEEKEYNDCNYWKAPYEKPRLLKPSQVQEFQQEQLRMVSNQYPTELIHASSCSADLEGYHTPFNSMHIHSH